MTTAEVLNICKSRNAIDALAKKKCIAHDLRRHAENRNMVELLKERYPTEPEDVMNYRRKNLPYITKIFFAKVNTVLSRIRQARDFSVTGWDKEGLFKDFERYCLYEYAPDGSIVDWVFNSAMESMLVEPNGVILVGPAGWFDLSGQEIIENGLMGMTEPVCRLFRSENVLAYARNRYCHIYSSEQCANFIVMREEDGLYSVHKGVEINGKTEYIPLLVDSNGNAHYLSTFPAIVLGGNAREFEPCEIYDSYVSAAIPALDKIIQTKSEEDLMIKENLHARLFIETEAALCPQCFGDKHFKTAEGETETCKTCNGSGYFLPTNAAAVTLIRRDKGDMRPFNIPAGYLTPETGIITTISGNIAEYWRMAYSAINLEFLAETPAAQAGIAKEYDKQELNSFLYKIGCRLINNILNPILNLFAEIMYGQGANTAELRKSICPSITIPVDFNLRSLTDIQNELIALRSANVSREIFAAMELEFIERQFANQPAEKQILTDINKMNPLAGVSDDTRAIELARGDITEQDSHIASNIANTVRSLYQQDKYYALYSFEKRKQIAYAEIAKKFPTEQARATINDAVDNDFTETFNTIENLDVPVSPNQNNSDIATQTDPSEEDY